MTRDLLISYYGDDFTGATDALDALTIKEVPTVLFLEPPTPERMAAFPEVAAVGLAGMSRSQSPTWMDKHLPAVFGSLKALGARLCHYKVCSTFDSRTWAACRPPSATRTARSEASYRTKTAYNI